MPGTCGKDKCNLICSVAWTTHCVRHTVQYVCLQDIHFGKSHSLLTPLKRQMALSPVCRHKMYCRVPGCDEFCSLMKCDCTSTHKYGILRLNMANFMAGLIQFQDSCNHACLRHTVRWSLSGVHKVSHIDFSLCKKNVLYKIIKQSSGN